MVAALGHNTQGMEPVTSVNASDLKLFVIKIDMIYKLLKRQKISANKVLLQFRAAQAKVESGLDQMRLCTGGQNQKE